MFEKNDKQLLTVRIILNVVTAILVAGGVIAGIVLSALGMLDIGLPILFVVPFISWLMWVFVRLHLSHLCDIKLIRNKLYGVENDNLKVFLEEKANTEFQKAEDMANNNPSNNTEQLLRLKRLLDSGAITQEEFDREKEKLLK